MIKFSAKSFPFIVLLSTSALSVIQHNENFYTAKFPGKKLSLVMERIDARTLLLWKKYAEQQTEPWVIRRTRDLLKSGGTGEGSRHFKMVLDEVNPVKNEIWVAYITKDLSPTPIPDFMNNYEISFSKTKRYPFAKDIEMFVTVTSSPKALITSHMGVAMSAEAVFFGREKGTSVDLHSFAAKVMLMHNPKRKFMVNAPIFAMEKIIVNALPAEASFVGTIDMFRKALERQEATFAEFMKRDEVNVRDWLKDLNETDPQKFVGKDGNAVFPQGTNPEVKKTLEHLFASFRYPFPLSGGIDSVKIEAEGQVLLDLMKAHPPILSQEQDVFTIFDFENGRPWLIINKSNKDYQWMYTEPFRPGQFTYYFVVDLQALANSKAVE